MANKIELVLETTPEGCIVPISHKLNSDGYFRKLVWVGGYLVAMMYHKYVWEQRHGVVPEGYEVDHKCNNRACCNIEHLRVLHGSNHTIHTNKERYAPRKAEAEKHWLEHRCTGTALSQLFDVAFGTACGWIRSWKLQENTDG